jgi:lipopolysaccharide transport system ATP-binding protein
MIAPPIISAHGVGKKYLLGSIQAAPTSLREALVGMAKAPLRRMRSATATNGEEFWALRDISFDVAQGEVMGIVGRNGAGKSTLLKVLSRITDPTEGRIEMRGRSASLLEVGTGFHPELTGRENIYLNGTILGMRKREIDRKFDQIVAFAEIERFIDTPVKRYSSGMYVRLAFGVAAHLDPEILIVDEVLAVGDAEFQKKCLTKMSDVASEGRTVLFVSHNMAAIKAICTTGLLLKRGHAAARGPISEIVDAYVKSAATTSETQLTFPIRADGRPQFARISTSTPRIEYGETLEIDVELASAIPTSAAVEIEVHDERGVPIAYVSTAPMGGKLLRIGGVAPNQARFRLGPLPLATGRYDLYFWLAIPYAECFHATREPLSFEVTHSDPANTGFEFRQSYGRGPTTVPMSYEFA